jgi:large subunit ribosomal protein L35
VGWLKGHALPLEPVNGSQAWSACTTEIRKREMPKLKTKSGAKKRFKVTGTGKVRAGVAFKRHNLRKRSQKMKRQNRGTQILSAADARIVKSYMPYL